VAGLVVLLIIAGLLAVQFGRQVYANWEIGQRAAQLEAEIAAIEAENDLLAAELGYLRSDAYVSAEARRLANLGATGDQVLIIPSGAEAPLPAELAAADAPSPLLEQWWALFFGPSGP
jgi:cell division protein FtsB